jgi:NAD(P)-dependent dehydrogenase (short-subunit alcohol dehydrogenase family)
MATILITGCSEGIGYETALTFARAGHNVLATMRTPANSPQLAEIATAESLPITVLTMDVDSDSSVSTCIAALLAEGPIDLLINNAGIEMTGSVEEQSLSQFRAVMETNYFGAIRCIQAVVPSMRERQSGGIFNISSVAGRLAIPPLTPYCASKWALEALSEGLAGELKTFNVRVALIEPGIINTAMAQRIGVSTPVSHYRQGARFAAMFANSLQQPVPPSLVAEAIYDVYNSGTWIIRHLVGPDAVPFIELRRSMSDEAWAELNAGDDASFFARLSGN